MFCSTCGTKIHEKAVVCTGCGCAIGTVPQGVQAWGIGMMIFLCVSTFVIPLIGWIVGVFNLKHSTRRGQAIFLIVAGCIGAWLYGSGFWEEFWIEFEKGFNDAQSSSQQIEYVPAPAPAVASTPTPSGDNSWMFSQPALIEQTAMLKLCDGACRDAGRGAVTDEA